MKAITEEDGINIERQNRSYYDHIAGEYDAILEQDPSNNIVRSRVAEIFRRIVVSGNVLDFGGGTGGDISWLAANKYNITFCEPSGEMRKIALLKSQQNPELADIRFLDDQQTDFRTWREEYPFQEKADAVLANFAVFNCIPDIELLLDRLAMVMKPGASVIAVILESHLRNMMRANLKGALASFFSGNAVRFVTHHQSGNQFVYIHKLRRIKAAMKDNYQFISSTSLHGFGFTLIHLLRK